MAENTRKYTVLGAGEKYMGKWEKRYGPQNPPPFKRSVDEARKLLSAQAATIGAAVEKMPQWQRLDEVVIEVRLDEKFLAKSHHPEDFLKKSGLIMRGAGVWMQPDATGRGRKKKAAEPTAVLPEPQPSKSLFVSGTQKTINELGRFINRVSVESVEQDLRKIEEIRIPTSDDRLGKELKAIKDPTAVEILLHRWDPDHADVSVERLLALFHEHGIDDVRTRTYDDGPTFMAAVLPPKVIAQLGKLNYLRVARSLPRVRTTRDTVAAPMRSAKLTIQQAAPTAWMAVFDGGFKATPQLAPYMQVKDLTTKAAVHDGIEHGTAVVSAAVYGPLDPAAGLPPPRVGVHAFRVLPDPQGDELELWGVIDAIEAEVPKLPANVRVVNLSLGPVGPAEDRLSRFTYSLDRLTRTTNKIFFCAVGNWGDRPGEERIQAPSDSVNNVAIGAYTYDADGSLVVAPYSCRGPGRAGGAIKPDVLAFGGSQDNPFWVLDPAASMITGVAGTSFAAPVAAALAASMIGRLDTNISNEAVRALLIHSASALEGSGESIGHGAIARDHDEVLACSNTRVSVLYEGDATPREHWKLPFLLPTAFDAGGDANYSWTIVYTPEVESSTPDEYTLVGLDLGFRPDSDKYTFSPPKNVKSEPMVLNVVRDAAKVAVLEKAGWRRGVVPVAAGWKAKSEQALRSSEGKWETIIRSGATKRRESVKEPMLTLSTMGRGRWDKADATLRIRFAAVLTVDAPKYNGDLYGQVLTQYDKLRPLVLRTTQPVRVHI